jgi:hypothetical protein
MAREQQFVPCNLAAGVNLSETQTFNGPFKVMHETRATVILLLLLHHANTYTHFCYREREKERWEEIKKREPLLSEKYMNKRLSVTLTHLKSKI